MKRLLLLIALIFVIAMDIVSCGNPTDKPVIPRDDPQANTLALVETINGTGSIEDAIKDAEMPKAEDITSLLAELSFEADAVISGSLIGKDPVSACVKINDGVAYLKTPNDGDGYIFIEDDLTLVTVHDNQGQVSTELKDTFSQLEDFDLEEYKVNMVLWLQLLLTYELPEITADDIEYINGKYYLTDDYIRRIGLGYVDTVIEYEKECGRELTDDEIKEMKDVVPKTVEGLNLKFAFLVVEKEITGIYIAVNPTEKFKEEYFDKPLKDCYEMIEISKDRVYINLKLNSTDGTHALYYTLDAAFTYDEDGVLTKVVADGDVILISEEVVRVSESSFGFITDYYIGNEININLNMTLDLAAFENGGSALDLHLEYEEKTPYVMKEINGTFLYDVTEQKKEEYGNDNSMIADINWSVNNDKESSALVLDVSVINGVEAAQTLKVELNLKHSSDMTAPKDVVDAKDAAIAEQNSAQ